MKVLSIKEPYATLIKNNKKLIETRSWKTNYRGELYIHASLTKAKSELNYCNNLELNYGKIICKCNLVNCVYMTKEFVENMKNNNFDEYELGIYEEGRYAWILDEITPIEKPIIAKGKLGIWNFDEELINSSKQKGN